MAHRAGLDQQAVIQAAAELADSVGYEEVTLALLAGRLGIRTPTLYHYFDGLDGLKRQLALRGKRELGRVLGRAVMGRSGDEALEAMAIAYRAYAQEHSGLYRALQRAAARDDTAMLEADAEVVEIVLRVLAPLRLQRENAIHTVRLWRSLLHGFVSLELDGGFGLPQDIDETFRRLVVVTLQMVKEAQHHERTQ